MHSNVKDPRWCKCVSKVGNLGAATNAGNYIWEAGKEQERENLIFINFCARRSNGLVREGGMTFAFLRIFFLCQVVPLKYFALSSNGPFLFWSPFHRLFVGWIEANFRRHSKGFFSNSCHQKSGHAVLYPFLEIAQRFFHLSVVVKRIAVWFNSVEISRPNVNVIRRNPNFRKSNAARRCFNCPW